MNNSSLLGPWIRRFLIEYLVGERNLAINTQKSYRDMLMLLLPYLAAKVDKRIDRLSVDDLSAQMVRLFLTHMEEQRHCMVSTRNQRLGGIHALARFIGEHAPEYVEWWAQIHLIPVKRTSRPEISYLSRQEMDALLAASDMNTAQGQREHALLLFMFNSGARASEAAQLRIGDIDWHTRSASIVGKGNKHRRCPLWKSTIEALRSQTEGRAAAEPVFLNRFHQTMTRSGIHALGPRRSMRTCRSSSKRSRSSRRSRPAACMPWSMSAATAAVSTTSDTWFRFIVRARWPRRTFGFAPCLESKLNATGGASAICRSDVRVDP